MVNLPTMIVVAVAVPVTVVALVWLFAEMLGWLAPRPRLRGVVFGIVGLGYLVPSLWEGLGEERGWDFGLAFRIALGIFWLAWGWYEYRRGPVATVDTPQE
jgi:hypothetical protein